MKNKIFLLLSLFVISYSCYKEGPIKPIEGNEKFVNVDSLRDQGTNMYQQRLLDYFDKYKVLTMYQFNPLLFNYEITGNPPYHYSTADEASIGALLDVIDELFYDQIGDKAILKYTPRNILLVSNLRTSNTYQIPVDSYLGLFCFTFSGADSEITSWNRERKQQYKNDILYNFTLRMHDKGLIGTPTDFLSVSDYLSKVVNVNNYKEFGFIKFDPKFTLSSITDFRDYLLMAITTPTAELTAKGGLLDPAVDKKGLILKKYEALVAFYKSYDVDLVKIANYQIK